MDLVADEDSELVLGVNVRAGNAREGEGGAPLQEAAQGVEEVEVRTLLGDMAYSDGDVREAVEEAGGEMAKVPPATNSGRFPKSDFVVDTEAGTVTCPAGETTTKSKKAKHHKGRRGLLYVFPAGTCVACPLRDQCPGGTKGRTVFVGRDHDRIASARAAQDDATKALLRRRAKIERKIDHLQDLGMRKARYRGRRKTRLQARSRPRWPTSSGSACSARSTTGPRSPLPHEMSGDTPFDSPPGAVPRGDSRRLPRQDGRKWPLTAPLRPRHAVDPRESASSGAFC